MVIRCYETKNPAIHQNQHKLMNQEDTSTENKKKTKTFLKKQNYMLEIEEHVQIK